MTSVTHYLCLEQIVILERYTAFINCIPVMFIITKWQSLSFIFHQSTVKSSLIFQAENYDLKK